MKTLLVLLVGIIVVVFVLSFFKDIIIKTSVEKGVEIVTGLQMRVQSLKVGIINTLVGIRNLRLFNPPGFKDKIMLDMPEIYIDYDLGAILKGKIHLEEMRINMNEFMVVKNEKGVLNLDSLKVVQAQQHGAKPGAKEKGKAPEIQIDSLELKIGKVIYKDYSQGGKPVVKEFPINLNESYKNITNPYSLVSLIVVKALMNTTIANLTGFDLQGLQGTVSDTLATAQKVAQEAIATAREAALKAQKVLTGTTQKAEESVKEATETLTKTAEDLKDVFKSPFGSKSE